jgi:hypothetical protein
MLMIQKMQGYVDSRQEKNGQTRTGWHYMAANGPSTKWQVGLNVPVGPGNEIRCACAR